MLVVGECHLGVVSTQVDASNVTIIVPRAIKGIIGHETTRIGEKQLVTHGKFEEYGGLYFVNADVCGVGGNHQRGVEALPRVRGPADLGTSQH